MTASKLSPPARVLVTKIGLDGHDRGSRIVAAYLRDAGMEVIYTPPWQSIGAVVKLAMEEDVDVIGVSSLATDHLIVPKLMEALRAAGLGHIGLLVGGIPAMISAYRRGRIDTALNTGSYVVLAFPAIVAVIAIVSFWGHSLWKITLIIGLFAAPLIFRVVRASTLSYATRDFVLAAKALGASDTRILTREILPNIMPTIVSFGLIAVATIIVLEGSLAFLGLSVPPPTASWGNMLNEGSSLLTGAKGQTNPWLVIFPASAMFLLLISLNVVADKLRSYFDVTDIKL